MQSSFDGSFFDEDYFENGRTTGKSWLENYHWIPQRSFREALAYIDYMKLDAESYVLDFGCAKGFIVRALRELEIRTDGCDISDYALSFAPSGCWNSTSEDPDKPYTHIICKDVLEHMDEHQLDSTLQWLYGKAKQFMVVVPIGDNGLYRIPEYHFDKSHLIAEDEAWWMNKFNENGWRIRKHSPHVIGLKDNWKHIPNGNHVFMLTHS